MKIPDTTVLKYLKRNPLQYPLLPSWRERKFKYAVVIPAFAEFEYLPHTLKTLGANGRSILEETICIIVVNNPADVSETDYINNQNTIELLNTNTYGIPNLFYLDASSRGHELKDACVGAARKLGMDTALSVLDISVPDALILCLDSDTLVEENYLEAAAEFFKSEASEEIAGAVFNFRHQAASSPAEAAAIQDYELYMRYYVAGLIYAGSPYAYHSLGSAILCRAMAYAACGGMKPRKAGEDFYFMQSLRKTGKIASVNSTCIYPSPRASGRVPFGTGRKIGEILKGGSVSFYNSLIFEELKKVLDTVKSMKSIEDFAALNIKLKENSAGASAGFFAESDFDLVWPKIYENTRKDTDSLEKAFHTWFDAFRTLKYIHFLEAENFAPQGFGEAVNHVLRKILPDFKESDEKAVLLGRLRDNNI